MEELEIYQVKGEEKKITRLSDSNEVLKTHKNNRIKNRLENISLSKMIDKSQTFMTQKNSKFITKTPRAQ